MASVLGRLVSLTLLSAATLAYVPSAAAMSDDPALRDAPQVSADSRDVIEWVLVRGTTMRFNVTDVTYWDEDPQSYQIRVQVRRGGMRRADAPHWEELTFLEPDFDSSVTLPVRQGQVACARARLEGAEVRSAWSQPACVVRALDDSRLRRHGRTFVRRSKRFIDGRVTVLRTNARLVLPGRVPNGADFGPVMIDNHILNDGHDMPQWYLRGGSRRPHSTGGSYRHVLWLTYRAKRGGRAVITTGSPFSYPIGGFIVIPRWAQHYG